MTYDLEKSVKVTHHQPHPLVSLWEAPLTWVMVTDTIAVDGSSSVPVVLCLWPSKHIKVTLDGTRIQVSLGHICDVKLLPGIQALDNNRMLWHMIPWIWPVEIRSRTLITQVDLCLHGTHLCTLISTDVDAPALKLWKVTLCIPFHSSVLLPVTFKGKPRSLLIKLKVISTVLLADRRWKAETGTHSVRTCRTLIKGSTCWQHMVKPGQEAPHLEAKTYSCQQHVTTTL